MMTIDVIQIKCPHCGARLSVKLQKGIENKKIRCPVCKEWAPFGRYKQLYTGDEEGTNYANRKEEKTSYKDNAAPAGQPDFILGRLKFNNTQYFNLRTGRNVIGRQSAKSKANIQIPTGDNKRMSREHLVIEIKKEPEKGFVHYVSLCKQRVNKTFLNDMSLEYGDCVILKHKDIIKLPDCNLTFEIPDDEETEID